VVARKTLSWRVKLSPLPSIARGVIDQPTRSKLKLMPGPARVLRMAAPVGACTPRQKAKNTRNATFSTRGGTQSRPGGRHDCVLVFIGIPCNKGPKITSADHFESQFHGAAWLRDLSHNPTLVLGHAWESPNTPTGWSLLYLISWAYTPRMYWPNI
jgi:hypothetical protein